MRLKRKIIEIDEKKCSGCGLCATACAEGAIELKDGKARLVSEVYCDGLGACLGECPEGALTVIERESEEFNPEAVEEYLKHKSQPEKAEQPMACGCPSQHIQMFAKDREAPLHRPSDLKSSRTASSLSHWPVQIKLVPAKAPFLQGADLLIAADCTSVAYPDFHSRLLPGKAVLIGCPKFDNIEEYLQKFVDIFRQASIRSITVVDMEVPCCSKLPALVRRALELSGQNIPLSEIVISVRGEILEQSRKIA
ncbi:MAG TPA: 4Fe-4S binding protein [Syntrophorhabdales bacterium]|nr:4Fe-4S binding protein [Syntrophorhabdales bacterium]